MSSIRRWLVRHAVSVRRNQVHGRQQEEGHQRHVAQTGKGQLGYYICFVLFFKFISHHLCGPTRVVFVRMPLFRFFSVYAPFHSLSLALLLSDSVYVLNSALKESGCIFWVTFTVYSIDSWSYDTFIVCFNVKYLLFIKSTDPVLCRSNDIKFLHFN